MRTHTLLLALIAVAGLMFALMQGSGPQSAGAEDPLVNQLRLQADQMRQLSTQIQRANPDKPRGIDHE